MIYNTVHDMIGNTPLLRIDESVHGIANLTLYAKLEMMNPFGSVKDRIAKSMFLTDAESIKKEGRTVIESSSGNTAKALSVLCAMHAVPFKTVTNRIKSNHMRETLRYLNAELVELPGISDCPDPTNPDDPLYIIEQTVTREPDRYYHTDQYFNPKNVQAHYESGREIHDDLGDIDYFFADLGTCGTSVGIGTYLREHQEKKAHLIGVVTEEGSYVPGGRSTNELYETGLYNKAFYDGIVTGSTRAAITGMQRLAHRAGLLCGPTTGLIFSSVTDWFSKHPPEQPTTAVFIACDRLEAHLEYLKAHQADEQTMHESAQAPALGSDSIEGTLTIDIRTNIAFRLGHIPGSINIPTHLLEQMISTGPSFPNAERIVLICPIGEHAKPLVSRLRAQGYDAYVLEGGIVQWRADNNRCEPYKSSAK